MTEEDMGRKIGLGLLWLGTIVYATAFAPPTQPGTFELIKNLSIGQFEQINPLIIALFYIMGVFPVIYSALLLIDGKMQKIPAWPFVLGSFGAGAFALLPYLALRESSSSFSGPKTPVLKLMDSRLLGATLLLSAMGLVVYGLIRGDWQDFVQQWQTSRFIHVMSLDFCLLCLLFPLSVRDDMARRGVKNSLLWAISLIPLLGAAIYLTLRPPLIESAKAQPEQQLVKT